MACVAETLQQSIHVYICRSQVLVQALLLLLPRFSDLWSLIYVHKSWLLDFTLHKLGHWFSSPVTFLLSREVPQPTLTGHTCSQTLTLTSHRRSLYRGENPHVCLVSCHISHTQMTLQYHLTTLSHNTSHRPAVSPTPRWLMPLHMSHRVKGTTKVG